MRGFEHMDAGEGLVCKSTNGVFEHMDAGKGAVFKSTNETTTT